MNIEMDSKNPNADEVKILVNNNENAQNGSRNHYSEQERYTGSGHAEVGELCEDVENRTLHQKDLWRSRWRLGPKFNMKLVIIGKVALVAALIVSVGFNIAQHREIQQLKAQLPAPTQQPGLKAPTQLDTSCPQAWDRDEEMCYFFSRTEGTWNSSQSHCSSYGGFLIAMDTQQEKEFVKRKAEPTAYWINLRRESVEQPWKWPNDSLVGDWFQIVGNGLCAYLNDNVVSSTYCDQCRNWICRKPVLVA